MPNDWFSLNEISLGILYSFILDKFPSRKLPCSYEQSNVRDKSVRLCREMKTKEHNFKPRNHKSSIRVAPVRPTSAKCLSQIPHPSRITTDFLFLSFIYIGLNLVNLKLSLNYVNLCQKEISEIIWSPSRKKICIVSGKVKIFK